MGDDFLRDLLGRWPQSNHEALSPALLGRRRTKSERRQVKRWAIEDRRSRRNNRRGIAKDCHITWCPPMTEETFNILPWFGSDDSCCFPTE